MTAGPVALGAVLDATGATYRQLDHWARSGYLRPRRFGHSQGFPRHWPPAEVRIAARMVRLVRAGLAVPESARIARYIETTGAIRVELAPGLTLEVLPE